MDKPWWLPKGWHAETWVCSMRCHVVVDETDDDRLSRDELVRCIRCDAWVPRTAVTAVAPGHRPRRGKELHQAIVLRFVAIDRAFHALVLIPIGLLLGWLSLRLGTLSTEARQLAEALASVSSNIGHLGGQLNSAANKVAVLKRDHIRNLALLALAFGAVEGAEAVGLWLEQRWAEYLTVLVTASLLPLEVHELIKSVTVLKVVGFVINVAIVVYLIWAKHLFGVRGGARQERADELESVAAAPNPQRAVAARGIAESPH